MSPTPSLIVPRALEGALPSRLATFAALHCPFSQSKNRHEQAAGEAARAWVLERFGDSQAARKLVAASMEEFTAGFYPTASLTGLTWVTKFLLWAFVLDDLVDETDVGRGASSAAALIERLDLVMRRHSVPNVGALESTFAELLNDLIPFLGDGEYEEFCESLRAYFGALVWEANNRAAQWVPDLVSFELFRPAAGAVPPFWMLIGPLENLRLCEAEKSDPELQRAQALAGRIACWYNDVLSYEKEYAAKDVHNLAIVLERHRYLTPLAAFEAAIDYCNNDVQQFCDAAAELAPNASATLEQYLATLQSMMATTLIWTLESARYGGTAAQNQGSGQSRTA